MRICRFYTPSDASIKEHDGVELATDYPYDIPLEVSACTCPSLQPQQGFAMCGYEADQQLCGYYEAEPDRTLRATDVASEPAETLSLVATRVRFGIRVYHVTSKVGDAESTIVSTVNAHTFGEGALQAAIDAFEEELLQRGDLPRESLDVTATPDNSYLEKVVL